MEEYGPLLITVFFGAHVVPDVTSKCRHSTFKRKNGIEDGSQCNIPMAGLRPSPSFDAQRPMFKCGNFKCQSPKNIHIQYTPQKKKKLTWNPKMDALEKGYFPFPNSKKGKKNSGLPAVGFRKISPEALGFFVACTRLRRTPRSLSSSIQSSKDLGQLVSAWVRYLTPEIPNMTKGNKSTIFLIGDTSSNGWAFHCHVSFLGCKG